MKFFKYPSLVNSYRERTINYVELHYVNKIFCCFEKLDGANFSMYMNSDENIKFGSRTQFIDGVFYNCQSVIDAHKERIKLIWSLLNGRMPDLEQIIIYGELIGEKINGRVKYNNEVEFYAFDLAILRKDGSLTFYSPKEAYELFCCTGFDTAPILYSGKLNDCLMYKNDTSTKISKSGSIMEGVVIKGHYQHCVDHNNNILIIKNKNEKFSEIKKKVKHVMQCSVDFGNYITSNRLLSVISKLGGVGELDQKDFGSVLGLYCKDVIEDLIQDEVIPENYKKIDGLKNIHKFISKDVATLLKKDLLPLL